MKRNKDFLKIWFKISLKDLLIMLLILFCASLLCAILNRSEQDNSYVSMILILAVFMVARFSDGYACGILASFIGVLGVNYIFTYPYFQFNFNIAGYPLTVICMFAVSITTSALTTQVKQSEAIKIEVEKEKTKSNLLRAISHDLRTPLTSIFGATSAVIDNDGALSSEERIGLLSSARDDAQWLIRIVENLLAVTRINGESHANIIKSPEAAEEIVSDAVLKFKKRFPTWNVSVTVPTKLLMIPMDGILIEQVIVNLIENSVIHGKTASKTELLVTQSGTNAVFEVRDNGVGIVPANLSKIFDGCMSSTRENDRDRKRNMGIGLSVCNTIIKAHGGTMNAFNSPQGGAVFQFRLEILEGQNEL